MPFKRSLLLILCALAMGPVVAFSCHIFLTTLDYMAIFRGQYTYLIWGLPILGLFMSWAQKRLPQKFSWSVTHFIYELREPRHRAHPLLAVWICIMASLAHLFGGSVGREGVGLVLSGSLVDGILPFKENSRERTILLQAALTAGFTGMFGTPLAAIFFIYEVNDYREALSASRWATLLTAVFSTFGFSVWLGTPHTFFSTYTGVSWTGHALMYLAIPLACFIFYYVFKFFHKSFKRLGNKALPIGGLLISCILALIGTRYSGLGTEIIVEAINGKALPWDWMGKLLLTALTIAVGFKGGEVTPLFFIGATLGASIGSMTGDPGLAQIGMVAVLGSLTHTPISAGLLGAELFRSQAFLPCFLLTLWGHILLRHRHLYRFD